jgi:Fur family ferric uptake transcriptional regulator
MICTPPLASPAELRATIRATGLRSTATRMAVLHSLQQANSPVSHADLTKELAAQGFDRATIYRTLRDLTEVGVLSRRDVGDHVWRFKLTCEGTRGQQSEHPHFVCTACGAVSCLPGVQVRLSRAPGVLRARTTKNIVVRLQGLCDRCAA